jgi:hypothetical protein
MFTGIAVVLLLLLLWRASSGNKRDRSTYDLERGDDAHRLLLLHIRQDLKVVVFLLGGIMVLLGILADGGLLIR